MSVGRRAAAAAILVIGLTAAPASASTASQTGADPSPFVSDEDMPALYTPPADIPSVPGSIIRSEPMSYHSDPLHVTQLPGTATRVMYTSRD